MNVHALPHSTRFKTWRTLCFALALAASLPVRAETGSPFNSDFQKAATLPQGWKTQGEVTVDVGQSFKPGGHSLALRRSLANVGDATGAVSPAFPVTPGVWEMGLACKSDLVSQDSSFRALVTLEFLDGADKVVDQVTLADVYGEKPWQAVAKRIETPQGAASARFRVDLQKTWGEFRVDNLSAAFAAAAPRKDKRIDRMYFVAADPSAGHFLYPEEPKKFTVTVEATEPLPPEQLAVTCSVRDYWGAEQADPVTVRLADSPEKKGNRLAYSGTLDLGKLPLEIGKYYEIHGEIERAGAEPFRNYSSFVIKPEAVANSYKPTEIPFSQRNWDGRIPEGFTLSHRLGIRIMCVWSGWAPTPPYAPHAPGLDLIKKFGMGGIFGTPASAIQTHEKGWEKYDEKSLREGVRNFIQTYRKSAEPFIITLGNEPPAIAERMPANILAYRVIYDEVKKTDPTVMVLGTSCGADEMFFKAGFGEWCDAYDFHGYSGSDEIAKAFERYQELFKEYGHPKPIWSTEIGLNSQGVSRRAVAIDMIKKFAFFFANGGGNISWFDLFYPDRDAKNAGSSSEAHDAFDSRYLQYAPKLNAVTYYDLINSIAIKKFVEEKQYGGGIRAFLFRDRDNRQLQILWKDKGRQDAFLPLPGVKDVEVVRIDGARRKLNADGKGVTLTLGEDPLLLLYDGTAPLAGELGAPAASIAAVPDGLVRGTAATFTVNLSGSAADQVNLLAPPDWKVTKETGGQSVKFTLASPETTAAREADLIVTLGDGKGLNSGELSLRPLVTGQLTAQILPVPASGEKPAGVKLLVKNNGTKSQDVTWEMSLADQIPLIDGKYEQPVPVVGTRFAEAANGQATLAGGVTREFFVPLADIDSQAAYRVHAVVTDAAGDAVIRDRNVAGFVSVPKAKGEIKLDGTLDGPDWKRAPVEKIVEPRQYYTFDPKLAAWKGPEDLSATVRFLWDDKYLYAGVEVTDDLAGNLQEGGGSVWMQDGLQFLIDPCRAMDQSTGKYDYGIGITKKGPGAFCYMTADSGAPFGEAKDIVVGSKRKDAKTGSITYVVAFPWSRLAPFQPDAGANLGLTLILNEDDGKGRKSFMTWFGNAHTKQVDAVGDLILAP
ncbi:MAG: sugar-binding protein [Terrimicrobiaceae bacterium]